MAENTQTTDSKSNNPQNDRFLADLADLETAFETPVVPGELEAWIETVDASTKKVAALLKEQFQVIHEQQFNDIAEQDGELLGRLEKLKEEDTELLTDFGKLSSSVARLRENLVAKERNETELDQATSKLVERGVSFVVRARTQETAIATWYSEAFLRDRGVGD